VADSRVSFEVVVEGKNIKVVQKQVQDLGKSIDKTTVAQEKNAGASKKQAAATNSATKATAHHNRGQKGVAHATNNGTKAFSKQRDAISGSSGLVGAYATLAANLFAATALFNALRGAAQVEQLTKGMTALGAQSGIAMRTLANELLNVTDNAISLEEAMRSTVQITSAGLDPSSVIRFGEAARNASIALGRNLGDTMDRLTRGVTKLEPELLDELGIFIRIDEVTRDYAASLGKTANQLTNFEKRIAFQNAALTQLEDKFQAVGESVAVNPFDPLLATIKDLGNTLANFINKTLAPLIGYLAQSPYALVGVLTALGGKVLKQAVTSFGFFTLTAEQQTETFKRLKSQIDITSPTFVNLTKEEEKFAKILGGNTKKIKSREQILKASNKAITEVTNSQLEHTSEIDRLNAAQKKLNKSDEIAIKSAARHSAAIASNTGNVEKHKAGLQRATNVLQLNTQARHANNLALFKEQQDLKAAIARQRVYISVKAQTIQQQGLYNFELATSALAQGRYGEAIVKATLAIHNQSVAFALAVKNIRWYTGGILAAKIAVTLLTSTVKFLGIALLTALPIIGSIILGLQLLWDIGKKLQGFFKSDDIKAFESALEKTDSTLEELNNTFVQLNSNTINQSAYVTGLTGRYAALGNTAKQVLNDLNQLAAMPGSNRDEIIQRYEQTIEKSKDFQNELKREYGVTSLLQLPYAERLKAGQKITQNIVESTDAAQKLADASKGMVQPFQQFEKSIRVKTQFTDAADAADLLGVTLNRTMDEFKSKGLSAYNALNQSVAITLQNVGNKDLLLQVGVDPTTIESFEQAKSETREAAEAVEDLQASIENLEKNGTFAEKFQIPLLKRALVAANQLLQRQEFIQGKISEEIKNQFDSGRQILRDANKAIVIQKKELASREKALAIAKEDRSLSRESIEAQIAAQNAVYQKQIEVNKAEIDAFNQRAEAWEGQAGKEDAARSAREQAIMLEKENTLLALKMINTLQKEVQVREAVIKKVQEEQSYLKAILDLEKRRIDYTSNARGQMLDLLRLQYELDAARTGGDISFDREMELIELEKNNKIAAANEALKIKEAEIALDYALLNAQFGLLDAQLEVARQEERITGNSYNKIKGLLNTARGITTTTASETVEAVNKALDQVTFPEIVVTVPKEAAIAAQTTIKPVQEAPRALTEDPTLQAYVEVAKVQTTAAEASAETLVTSVETAANRVENLQPVSLADARAAEEQAALEAANNAKAQAETEALIRREQAIRKFRALEIANIESQAKYYEDIGATRLAKAKELAALELQVAQVIADIRYASMIGDKQAQEAALARLRELLGLIQGINNELRAMSAERAARLGGEQAGGFAEARSKIQSKEQALIDPNVDLSDKMEVVNTSFETARNHLAELGGDGPLLAAVWDGATKTAEVWTMTFEKLGEGLTGWKGKMEEAGTVAFAVGATIGAIANIQAASSEQRVAGIEAEIEAEKRRDGKTAQSKAKIAALEAKAEKEKRKAFERNKKMQMAQTIMNTASGIMLALSTSGNIYVGIALAAMTAVMGALQLAAIASTSYQGGGAAPSGPTAISIGERSNTVDLAKSKSASGEIGYMRGQSGVGGINEFKPAFTGIKHRAAGGATTAYMVGEQGPELFVPKTPGTVVPNEDLATNPTQNVNFTIQAVDAEGVEQLLVKQKGHIIRMIRDAANSYGTPFLEEVNVGVYTPQAQGASRA